MFRMNKSTFLVMLVLLLLIFPTHAKSDINWSSGVGLQYGGLIGLQGAYRYSDTNLRLSLGLIGLSVGIEQILSKKLSIGVQGFGVLFTSGWGGFINYHLPIKTGKHFVFGLDLIRSARTSVLTASERSTNVLSVSVGFDF